MLKRFMVIAFATMFSAGNIRADILFSESFTYADGLPPPPWQLISGVGGQSIINNQLAITANQTPGVTGDYSRAFAGSISSGTLFAGYDLTITASPTDSGDNYFAHFSGVAGPTGSTFTTRVFLNLNAGVTQIALSEGATPAVVTEATPLTLNTVLRVVQGYDFSTGTSTLWLNPTSVSSPAISDASAVNPASVSAFNFRINNNTDGNKIVDNLMLATTFNEALTFTAVPEPNSIALVSTIGFTGLLAVSRRRKAKAMGA